MSNSPTPRLIRPLFAWVCLQAIAAAQAPDYVTRPDKFALEGLAIAPPFLAADFTDDDAPDAFFTSDGVLLMIHSPGMYPNPQKIAFGVSEFAALPGNGCEDLFVTGLGGVRRLAWYGQTAVVKQTWTHPAWETTIEFGGPTRVTSGPALGPESALVAGVSADGMTVLTALVAGNTFTPLASIDAGEPVKQVCVGNFFAPDPDLAEQHEVAFITSGTGYYGLYVYAVDDSSAVELKKYQRLDGAVALVTNRGGAGGRDSLAYCLTAGGQDYIYEITLGQPLPTAVACGPERVGQMAMARIGRDAATDLAVYSQTLRWLSVMAQRPPYEYPSAFWPGAELELMPNHNFFKIDAGDLNLYDWPIDNPSMVCADFDLDTYGDILLLDHHVPSNESPRLLFLRGRDDEDEMDYGCGPTELNVPSAPGDGAEDCDACTASNIEFGVNFSCEVQFGIPLAWQPGTRPNQVRFRVWKRPTTCFKVNLPALPGWVEPVPDWETRDLGSFLSVCHCVPLVQGEDNPQLVVLYLQANWQRVEDNGTVLTGPPSFWISTYSPDTARWILCHESDAYTPPNQNCTGVIEDLCGLTYAPPPPPPGGLDGPVMIRTLSRRSRIGPFATGGPPISGGN